MPPTPGRPHSPGTPAVAAVLAGTVSAAVTGFTVGLGEAAGWFVSGAVVAWLIGCGVCELPRPLATSLFALSGGVWFGALAVTLACRSPTFPDAAPDRWLAFLAAAPAFGLVGGGLVGWRLGRPGRTAAAAG